MSHWILKATALTMCTVGLQFFPSSEVLSQTSISFEGKTYIEDAGKWFLTAGEQAFEVLPDVVTIKFRQGYDASSKDTLYTENNTSVLRENKLGFVDIQVPPGKNPIEFAIELKNTGMLDSADVNTRGKYIQMIPDDPRFPDQWGLHNTGQTGGSADADIDAPEAWYSTTGSPSVIVAVIDSGVDINHEDLECNIWVNPGEDLDNDGVVWDTDDLNGVDDDMNGFIDDIVGWNFDDSNNNPRGSFYHGTHVAGIVGACGDNSTGVIGVAGGFDPNQGTRMMAINTGDDSPNSSVLDDSIIYAADRGANIITLSLAVGHSDAIDAAIDYAYNTMGVFVDNAAGNDAGAVTYPATDPNVVAVGATDYNDNRVFFSNFGPQLEVVAPGVDIWSTRPGNNYDTGSGTSFASPHVAGLAALMFAINPAATNADVRRCISDTAEDQVGDQTEDTLGRDDFYGYGRINAESALRCMRPCTVDEDCLDDHYCNGIETCDSGTETCLPGTPVGCPVGQICDEDTDQCVLKPCSVTIVPPSATVFAWESIQFSTTQDGTCNEHCFTWEISVQESTGSTINQNGLYTAGGNRGTDTIQVTDPCNGNISDSAMVNVVNPPDNDECGNSITVEEGVAFRGSTVDATGSDITSCAGNDALDVWHNYTPAVSECVTISTDGSNFDTTLAVFDACGGTELACDDDGGSGLNSQITIDLTAGQTYQIRIAGYGGGVGDYALTASSGCPCIVSVSPDAATVFTWESIQFSTTQDGTCNEPCYTWEVSMQQSTGSTIDQNGLYTAGGNAGTDRVRVTDPCNGYISDSATVTVLGDPVPLDCTKLLGSSQSSELFSIDVTTGSATLIGYMPGGLATEIEYDVLSETLYAEETNGGVNLHTIDPTTAISLGFVTHEFGALNGLEFVGSTLYGTHIPGPGGPSDLVIVDTSTGNLTHIGPTGYGPISGLAYNEGAEVMYGITAGGTPANLVTIDLSTGAATMVGPTGLDKIGSIEFGPDGNLYGGVTAFVSSFATYLVRIDTATGAATPIGETGYSITGLTACGAGDGCIVPCREAESGSLNIVETAGRIGSEVTATVEINSAPNLVDALGFEVTYNPDCLEYTGDWQPGSCILFWIFSFIEVTNPAPGVVRFGGFTVLDPVLQGESCTVVELPFTVVTPELGNRDGAVRLDLQTLVDDVAGWSASPGFICGGCSCDVNGNDSVTPQDALCAFQKYLEICPTSCGPCDAICGNINGDDQCTPADALCIFQEYLGIGCSHCN
jgi:subtilisin family serine protease